MTAEPTHDSDSSTPSPGAVALRASAVGALVAAAAVAAIVGLVSEDVLAADTRPFLAGGAAVGAVVGTLGNLLVARGALLRVGGPQASAEFLRSIVLDFGLQVFAVVAGTVGMFLLGVKFQEFAAFGTALAGAAVLFRVPGTVAVSRALTERATRHRAQSQSAASSTPSDTSNPVTESVPLSEQDPASPAVHESHS